MHLNFRGACFIFSKSYLILATVLLFSTVSLVYAGSPLDGIQCKPPVHIVHRPVGIQPFTGPDTTALSPSQVRAAYSLPSTGGRGTIAIIDAYADPSIQNDFNTFSLQYGLPTATAANFEIHAMSTTIENATTYGWNGEECLDTQWAHAIAPNAKILFVECINNGTDLLAGVIYAASRSDVVAISMSWGQPEFSGENIYDSYFVSNYTATFFAGTGDSGAGTIWPSVSPNVTAVGGTNLFFNSLGQVTAEIAWSGSGGGLSQYEPESSYQTGYGVPSTNGFRAVPDVSYNGGGDSYVSVYDSYQEGWIGVYGTSAGGPQWAAIRALGGSNINNTYLYSQASSPATYAADFRDITSGSNGTCGFYCNATIGYDYVTGLGSPLGNGLLSIATSPVAGFYGTPTIGNAPLTVDFTDTSANYPNSWNWSFGDGSTSISQNPSHLYMTTTEAFYTVQLIVTNSVGTSTSARINYIHALPPLPPSAGFYANPTNGASPLVVNFMDTSANNPTNWTWTFSDGSTDYSQNPIHTFYASNSTVYYSVGLAVSSPYGSSSIVQSNYITVVPAPTIVVLPTFFNKTVQQGTITYDYLTIQNTATNGTTLNWSISESVTSTFNRVAQSGKENSVVIQLPQNSKDSNPNQYTGPLIPSANPAASDGGWQYQTGLNNARSRAAAGTVNGKIYIIGGWSYLGSTITNSVEMFDPNTKLWTTKANKPTAVANIGCGVIGNKIYVPAGFDSTFNHSNVLEIYDTQFDSWTTGSPVPVAVSGAAVAVVNNKLYVMGGNTESGETNSVYEYDPVGDSWSQISSMNYACGYLGAAVVNNEIYAVGGWDNNNLNMAYCEQYNPTNGTWTIETPMNLARGDLGVCSDGYYIYAIGGGGIWTNFTSVVERFDPNIDTWVMSTGVVPFLNVARNALSVAVNNGTIYAIAGWNGSALTTNEVLSVDVLNWLDENPNFGSTNNEGGFSLVTVTFDATNLPEGSTTGWIGIINNDPNNNPVIIPVNLTVTLPGVNDWMQYARDLQNTTIQVRVPEEIRKNE